MIGGKHGSYEKVKDLYAAVCYLLCPKEESGKERGNVVLGGDMTEAEILAYAKKVSKGAREPVRERIARAIWQQQEPFDKIKQRHLGFYMMHGKQMRALNSERIAELSRPKLAWDPPLVEQ